jgi:hypothetical protein
MEYTAKHGKSYSSMEELQMRHERWNRVESYVKEHNEENPSANYTVGHNKFSDYTESEYRSMLGYKPGKRLQKYAEVSPAELKSIPTSWDWRDHNAVNPVKN